MPTSGEARIRPTSTYNLRSRPLPKSKPPNGRSITTRSVSRKNKENVPLSTTENVKKSQIPVAVRTTPTAKGHPSRQDTRPGNGSGGGGGSGHEAKTRVRTVPDFAKLHKSWQSSFNKGKACSKKQCTQVRAFDLTKPGTVFNPRYYDGSQAGSPTGSDPTEGDDGFETDDDALQTILRDDPSVQPASHQQGRLTLAGSGNVRSVMPSKPTRQTLAALPSAYQGRANNSANAAIGRDGPPVGRTIRQGPLEALAQPLELQQSRSGPKTRQPSLADQQKGFDVNFEPDAGALASIMNNKGAHLPRQAPPVRQTIGVATGLASGRGNALSSRPSMGLHRTSIYLPKPPKSDYDQVFLKFANHVLSRLSLAGNALPSGQTQATQRPATNQPVNPGLTKATLASMVGSSRATSQAPRRARTPAASLARRAVNPQLPTSLREHDASASPALRVPTSAMKKGHTSEARRVLNPQHQALLRGQDSSASPALRLPPSALKKASVVREGKAPSVRWADVLSPPGERTAAGPVKDEVVATLFADEDGLVAEPQALDMMLNQAASVKARQNEIQVLEEQAARHRNELVEMDEIEMQLEREIQILQETSPEGKAVGPGVPAALPSSLASATLQAAANPPPLLAPGGDHISHEPRTILEPEAPATREGAARSRHADASTVGAFAHSHGSPFRRSQDLGHLKDALMQSASVAGSIRVTQTADETAGHPFDDVGRNRRAPETSYPADAHGEPRMQYLNSEAPQMQTLQQASENGDKARRVQAVPIHHPGHAIPEGWAWPTDVQATAKTPFGPLGQDSDRQGPARLLRSDGGLSDQPASKLQSREAQPDSLQHYLPSQHHSQVFRENTQWAFTRNTGSQPSAPVSDQRLQDRRPSSNPANPLYSARDIGIDPRTDDSTSSLHALSRGDRSRSVHPSEAVAVPLASGLTASTPAPIRTPHALRSHSMVKELALRDSLAPQSLAATRNPGPAMMRSQDVPPIQTPLAMRTMSMWSAVDQPRASPVLFVSSIPRRPASAARADSKHVASADPHHVLALRSDHAADSVSANSSAMAVPSQASTNNETASRIDSGPALHPTAANWAAVSQEAPAAFPSKDATPEPVGFRPADPSQRGPADPLLPDETSVGYEAGANQRSSDLARPLPRGGGHPRPEVLRKAKAQGSLSLGAELLVNGGAAAFLKSKLKPLLTDATSQLFQEALLDEECALYACRLPSKFGHVVRDRQCLDPVAKILMEGDDMHFVPIQSKGRVFVAPVDSAFSRYGGH